MERWPDVEAIRTARLELRPLSKRFVDALRAGDEAAAAAEIEAQVDRWATADSSHVVQLHLAQQAGEAAGFSGFGRVIVLVAPRRARRMVGSVGFHGVPDDRGRLEVGCRIHLADRGQGYAAEAMAALVDWATARYGVTRFLVAIPARRDPVDLVPLEIVSPQGSPADERIAGLASLLEREWP